MKGMRGERERARRVQLSNRWYLKAKWQLLYLREKSKITSLFKSFQTGKKTTSQQMHGTESMSNIAEKPRAPGRLVGIQA